jgi:Cation transporting ATPase, C-terminus
LCVDLGTDVLPAVSFAYELPELDIMDRMPRNAKYDSLVTKKVIFHAYATNGFVSSFVAFYTWIQVLNDYGIRPTTVLFLALEEGYYPDENDVYDPNQPNFGNSNFGKSSNLSPLFWDGNTDSELDIRLFYSFREKDSWTKCRWDPNDQNIPRFWSYSDVTKKQICYTVEANKYGQSAFLASIVCFQIVNLFICKTRSLSISH